MAEDKPTIYNAPTIYKTGAEGGGGSGQKGVVFDINFKIYDGALSSYYLYPQVGCPFMWKKSNSSSNLTLDSEGLHITGSISYFWSYPVYIPSSNSGKIRFYQKTKGVTKASGGGWSRCGFFLNSYTNTNLNNRGIGPLICSDLSYSNKATYKNGWSGTDWGFTENGEPASTMLLKPSTALFPIDNIVLETEIVYDFDNKSISYKVNGEDVVEVVEVPDDLFYTTLIQACRFCIGSGGDKVIVERCTIELL